MYSNAKSKTPKNKATAKLTPITAPVNLIVCERVGQLTLFNSVRASFANVQNLFMVS